jgi:hypothetical protein
VGYDTEINTDGRRLLTRDRKLMEFRRAGKVVIFLQCNGFDASAEKLVRCLDVNWFANLFSRCLLCNGLTESAEFFYGNGFQPHCKSHVLPSVRRDLLGRFAYHAYAAALTEMGGLGIQ